LCATIIKPKIAQLQLAITTKLEYYGTLEKENNENCVSTQSLGRSRANPQKYTISAIFPHIFH